MTFGKVATAIATVAAAGLLAMAGLGLVPTLAGAGGTKLSSKLLSVSDLPTGWSATHLGTAGPPGPCGLSVFRKATKHGERATATFTHGSGGESLAEELATGSGELGRWKSLRHNLASCHQATVTEDGTTASLTIGALTFPKVTPTSRAYQLTLGLTGATFGVDIVLFRSGKVEGYAAIATIGSPSEATVEPYVKAAVERAEGKPVHLATSSGSGTTTGTATT